ncbi:hypothetical protein ACLSU7_18205 [Bdellovibrio sp. HCB185ZH]|uniref:hypothetical protein n=1 Tax=Bdellovibrio sp. HCB185ZH TaxID=3394235 RepID=UPI0039A46CBA
MKNFKVLSILTVLALFTSVSHALIVNGKGFQQRGFRFQQSGNTVDLIPTGKLSEVAVLGKKQILSILIQYPLRAQLSDQFLTSGVLRSAPANFSGPVELYVISQEFGKKAKLVIAPMGQQIVLPEFYVLRSESLGAFEVKNGAIQPFKDMGDGEFMYLFQQGYDGFKEIAKQFSLQGRVPQNMGSIKVEFRLMLTSSLNKPGWIALNTADGQEVVRFYVPMAAKSGQVISVVKDVPNLAVDENILNVVNTDVPMTDFKFRILELKTTRNYSAR